MAKHTLATALERCGQLAKHGKFYPSTIPTLDNNFNNNLLNSGQDDNNKTPENPSRSLTAAVYNYYPRGEQQKPPSIGRVVNNDPAFIMAKEWGVFGGTLTNYCKKYGISEVRAAIRFVAGIDDGYFDHNRAVTPQRGAYLNTVLNNGGLDDFHKKGGI